MIKKRALSLLLSVCMLLAMLPGTALAAQAPGGLLGGGSPTGVNDPVSYETRKGLKGTSPTVESGWQELTAAGGGTLTLRKDVKSSGVLNVPGGCQIVLNLNGRTLNRGLQSQSPRDGGGVLSVAANGELIVKSTPPNGSSVPAARGAIMGGSSTTGGGVHVRRGGRLELRSGCIIENASASYGGGIFNEGTVVMSGGTVSDNRGGGVYQDGLFTVSGSAKITGNETANVYLSAGKTLTADKVSGGAFGLFLSSAPEPGKAVTAVKGSVSSTEGYTSDQNLIVSLEEGNIVLRSTEKPAEPGQFMQGMDGPSADESDFIPQNQSQGTNSAANTYAAPRAAGDEVEVSFNLNGGDGTAPDSIKVTVGGKYAGLPSNPVRNGYDFTGWYTAESGGSMVTSDTTVPDNGKHTLYAHWRAKQIIVTFNYNDGSTTPTTKSVTYGKRYGTLAEPTRTGYEFLGWFTEQNGGEQITADTVVTRENNHTLYARWFSEGQLEITFHASTDQDADERIFLTNAVGKLNLPSPSKCGFTAPNNKKFKEWTIGNGADAESKNIGEEVTFIEAGPTDVFAVWEDIPTDVYVVTYNLNGGEGDFPTEYISSTDAANFTLATGNPVKTGFTFKGWDDGTQPATLYQSGASYTLTQSITFTAQWDAETITVTLEPKGGTFTSDSSTTIKTIDVTYGSAYGVNLPTDSGITNSSKKFRGWYTKENGGALVTPNTIVTNPADHTLYALWENTNDKTITFKPGDGTGENYIVYVDGTTALTLPDYWKDCVFVAPDDKEFDGWTTDPAATPPAKLESPHTFDADTIVTALWKDIVTTFTVTFNLNYDGAPTEETATYTSGAKYAANDKWTSPSRHGYTFGGWFTESTCTTEVSGDNVVTEDITLYAKWTLVAENYTIKFAAGTDASGTMPDVAVQKAATGNTSYTIPASKFTAPTGKVFNEWTVTNPTGNGAPTVSGYTLTIPGTLPTTTEITLTATWEEPNTTQYVIQFAAGTGATGTMSSVAVNKAATGNTTYTIPDPTFTKPADKVFKEWEVTAPTGDNRPSVAENVLTIPSTLNAGTRITLTAVWEDEAVTPPTEQYTIKFSDGADAESDIKVNKASSGATTYPIPSLTQLGFTAPSGKKFKEWTVSPNTLTIANGQLSIPESIPVSEDITLTAVWEDSDTPPATGEFTISFDGNNGKNDTMEPRTTQNGKLTLPVCSFAAPTGKIFDKWAIGSKTGPTVAAGADHTFTADTKVYALWKDASASSETVTITYLKNGGSGEMDSNTAVKGKYFNLPKCTFKAPTGKEFAGWDIDGTIVLEGKAYSFTEDTEVTATWKDAEQAEEKVQAIFRGGTDAVPTADYTFTYPKGTEIAMPYSMFNKANFTFTGWYDDSTGSNKELLKPNKRYKLERDTTFTAQWEAEAPTTYTVTFDKNTDNDAATVSPDSKTVTPGKPYGELPTPTWAGHDFLGWCAGENEYGAEITRDTTVTERNDHRIYALWRVTGEKKFKLTFTPDKGNGSDYVLLTNEEGQLILPEPEELGFTAPPGMEFDCWEVKTVSREITRMNPGDTYEFSENTLISAVWKAKGTSSTDTYTISFNANGGTGTMTALKVEAGKPLTLPSCTFTAPSGKTFDRWAIGSASGTTMAAGSTYTFKADTTLYAIWKDSSSSGGSSSGGSSGGGAYHPSRPPYWWDDDDDDDDESSARVIINAYAGTGGKISPSGEVRIVRGRNQSFTITPLSGYTVSDVLVDSKSIGPVSRYTFENVQRTHTIRAVFAPAFGTNSSTVQPPAVTPTTPSATNPSTSTAGRTDYSRCAHDYNCPISPFDDAQPSAWYHDGVHYCIDSGLMTGVDATHFAPSAPLTRGMLAQILYNREGRPSVNSGSSGFTDVDSGAWYEDAVKRASATGLVAGYENGAYGPNDPITREQLVVVLWRHAGSPASGIAVPLSDFFDTRAYADEAMRWAYGRGIISGKDNGLLDPGGQASRAEVAQMLKSYFDSGL